MYLRQLAVFVLFSVSCCFCASTRIWFRSCGKQGFTCSSSNRSIIYECPMSNREYHVYVNEFNGPSRLDTFTVRNCKTLTVFFRCTTHKWEKKQLKHLEISNVAALNINHLSRYMPNLPSTVVIKDVKLIQNVPSFSFSQIISRHPFANRMRCVLPTTDFHTVHFSNVTIGKIHPNAFYLPYAFGNVSFVDSKISIFSNSSVKVNHAKDGVFLMRKSFVNVIEPSAVKVIGNNVIFRECNFTKISSNGINASVETFNFENNTVGVLLPFALSVLAKNTFVSNNNFGHLMARALERIGPHLSKTLTGNLHYDFSGNRIENAGADSLHPNIAAYLKISAKVSFRRNILSCICGNSDWLIPQTENDATFSRAFYSAIFDDQLENVCSSSCGLPLSTLKSLTRTENCMENTNLEKLCEGNEIVSTPTATPESVMNLMLKTTTKLTGLPVTTLNTMSSEKMPARPVTFITSPGNYFKSTHIESTDISTMESSTTFDKFDYENTTVNIITSPLPQNTTNAYQETSTEFVELSTGRPSLTSESEFLATEYGYSTKQPITSTVERATSRQPSLLATETIRSVYASGTDKSTSYLILLLLSLILELCLITTM